MKRSALVAVAILAGASMLVACKPKAGASCNIETKEVCVGEKDALVCHDGKWEEMTCRGPSKCSKGTGESLCDQSVAEEKDVCNLPNDFVCTGDKKGMLECQKGRWTLAQYCFGERNCVTADKKVICDNSIANVGDVCREEEDYACSQDKKTALVCHGSKFVVANNCKGKNGCRVIGDKGAGFKIECDDSVANVGDACDREGHYACAMDEKSIVKCVGKKFVADEKCRGREKCAVKGELVGCY